LTLRNYEQAGGVASISLIISDLSPTYASCIHNPISLDYQLSSLFSVIFMIFYYHFKDDLEMGTDAETFSQYESIEADGAITVSGLSPNTVYYFRIKIAYPSSVNYSATYNQSTSGTQSPPTYPYTKHFTNIKIKSGDEMNFDVYSVQWVTEHSVSLVWTNQFDAICIIF
jgi:hypothetical protein